MPDAVVENHAATAAAAEETIDLSKKPVLDDAPPEQEKGNDAVIDESRFRQFTDEELEKFSRYAKGETDNAVADDGSSAKAEYLRAVLQELKTMIQDLRRAERDPLVADLLLRAIEPKIAYYVQTKSVDDYNRIIRLMKEVQYEINECSKNVTVNLAQEILNELKLEGIMLKKI